MAVKTPEIEVSPYTSTVPLVQIPPEAMNITPHQPLQGQFMKPGTGALAIGDAIFKGVLLGHQAKEQRKAVQAEATIAAADKAEEAAYQNYQTALSQAKGDVSDPKAKAAYDAYMGVFNQVKETKAKLVIPEKPGKGKTQGGTSGQGKDKKPGFMGGIKEFFEANPHLVPQIAVMAMQPKPEGQSMEARIQDAQLSAYETDAKVRTQELSNLTYERKQREEQDTRQKLERQVEENGGVDAVMANQKAAPELQQTARRMKYSSLDAMTPEGKLKYNLEQTLTQAITGKGGSSEEVAGKLSPTERVMAGEFGLLPKVTEKTVTGKNGNKYAIQFDPLTNQPVVGTKPLDLGPPAWEQEFYAKRAIEKEDAIREVANNPQAYGVKLTGNTAQDNASILATANHIVASKEFGIRSLAGSLGQTGFEIQRDSSWLNNVVKAAGLNSKSSPLDTGQVTISYPIEVKGQDGKPIPAGKEFAVGRDYFAKILNEFTLPSTEDAGVRGFRPTPSNPDGKKPEVLDAERRFLYNWVKNQMVSGRGKNALTEEQADSLLAQTALGTPIVAPSPAGGMTPPPNAPRGMTPPPNQVSGKPYIVPGVEGVVMLTPEDVKKAQAANIPIEDASGLITDFESEEQ